MNLEYLSINTLTSKYAYNHFLIVFLKTAFLLEFLTTFIRIIPVLVYRSVCCLYNEFSFISSKRSVMKISFCYTYTLFFSSISFTRELLLSKNYFACFSIRWCFK